VVTLENKQWGVLVSNTSVTPFRNVDILCGGNHLGKDKPIHFEVLPPGKCFVSSSDKSKSIPDSGWGKYIPLSEGASWEPVMKGKEFTVIEIKFQDNIGKKWRWSSSLGIQELAKAN